MPTLKNSRHELFAQEIAKGRSQREAYRAAGYLTKSDDATDANASRLLSNAKVADRIREIQTEAANSAEVTVSSLIAEAERRQALLKGEGQPCNGGRYYTQGQISGLSSTEPEQRSSRR